MLLATIRKPPYNLCGYQCCFHVRCPGTYKEDSKANLFANVWPTTFVGIGAVSMSTVQALTRKTAKWTFLQTFGLASDLQHKKDAIVLVDNLQHKKDAIVIVDNLQHSCIMQLRPVPKVFAGPFRWNPWLSTYIHIHTHTHLCETPFLQNVNILSTLTHTTRIANKLSPNL
jgi:hypothetical protein